MDKNITPETDKVSKDSQKERLEAYAKKMQELKDKKEKK
jgi:hypothetical protein